MLSRISFLNLIRKHFLAKTRVSARLWWKKTGAVPSYIPGVFLGRVWLAVGCLGRPGGSLLGGKSEPDAGWHQNAVPGEQRADSFNQENTSDFWSGQPLARQSRHRQPLRRGLHGKFANSKFFTKDNLGSLPPLPPAFSTLCSVVTSSVIPVVESVVFLGGS